MTDERMEIVLRDLIQVGLCDEGPPGRFSVSEAGRDFVENVLLPGVRNLELVYSLGRLQGLRERESAPT